MSATYQQSQKVSPDSIKIDPRNRLLSRGPRIRLSAEVDSACLTSRSASRVADAGSRWDRGILRSVLTEARRRSSTPTSGLTDWKTLDGSASVDASAVIAELRK
ncbi:MAG: DUF1553 domain-containing protein [Pseudomonadota bacterium]